MGKKKENQGEKTSFVLYGSYADVIKLLTREEKGILLEAIFAHEAGEELPEMPRGVAIAFEPIRFHLELDRKRYEEVCRENSRKARLRWERADSKRKPHREGADKDQDEGSEQRDDATACHGMPRDAGGCHNEYENENGNENENVNDDANGNERSRAAKGEAGSPPSRVARQQSPSPARKRDYFAEFWDRYPHKVYRDKARREWKLCVGEDEERAKAVLAALSRAVREDHRFLSGHIPYPSNWLRNDEPWRAAYAPPPDPVRAASARAEEEKSSSFDTDEFFQRALDRAYGRRPASS